MTKPRRKLSSTAASKREYANTPDELVEAVLERQAETEPAPPPEAPRVKMTISIDSDLLRELRVMASTLPPALFPSISGAIVEATRELVERMRHEHNEGEPFTSETAPKVRTGRRPGT